MSDSEADLPGRPSRRTFLHGGLLAAAAATVPQIAVANAPRRTWSATATASAAVEGSLDVGKDADIAIFEEDFTAWRTMIAGQWVYEQAHHSVETT